MMVTALPQSHLPDVGFQPEHDFFSTKNEEVQKQRCSLLKIHPVKSGIPPGIYSRAVQEKAN